MTDLRHRGWARNMPWVRLAGASLVAMMAAGLGAHPAWGQAEPGDPQCPIVDRIVTCSGDLPEGVRVPAGADRDGLTVENLTSDITLEFTTATARPAIEYTAGTATSTIRIVDPDNRISLTTAASAAAGPQNRRDLLTSAILVTATDNSNFSLVSDIDIDTRATCAFTDCTRRSDTVPNGITVRGSLGDFVIDNRGDISMEIEEDSIAVTHAILVEVFDTESVTIRNSGNLTAVNAGGINGPIDTRHIEITNDGSISLVDNREIAIGGISLLDEEESYADGFIVPRIPESFEFTYRIVNNGSIRVDGIFNDAGIRHFSSFDSAPGFIQDQIGTGEVVNNGTIEAATGILFSHSGEVTITNNGRIEANTAMLIFQGGPQEVIARIVNTASGVIVTNAGIIVDGDIADISNAGRIEASGDSARGITVRTAVITLESATIGNSGEITATGNEARAVTVTDNDGPTLFTSSGTITAEGNNAVGLYFEHESFDDAMPEDMIGTTEVDLAASSVVRGGSGPDGAGIRFFGGERNVVRNAGLITSQSGRAVVGGAAPETLDNSGRIEGSVLLAAGNDAVTMRGGSVSLGTLDGGADTDSLLFDIATGEASATGAIINFETVSKTGAGTLTLRDTATIAPGFSLIGGTLLAERNLGSTAIAASSGTTLSGSGSVGNVTIADGATVAPGREGIAGTLSMASLELSAGSVLRYDLDAPGTAGGANDLITVTGALRLDGLLDVNPLPNFGQGVYRLIDYGGALTDNGLVVRNAPTGNYVVQTGVAGQVNLVVSGSDPVPSIQFWDGPDTAPDGTIDGGSGTWDGTRTNWTRADGNANDAWDGRFAVFQGEAGTVTIDPAGVSATGLQFAVSGYTLTGGPLTLSAPATVRVGDGTAAGSGYTAMIGSAIGGSGGVVKTDLGTLILTGANSYTGGTTVSGGALQVSADTNLGAAAGGLTLDGGTLSIGDGFTSARALTAAAGGGTIDTQANSLTLSGPIGGTGAITKSGAGTLVLTGSSGAYGGGFALDAGELRLDGTLGGTLEAAAGTTLSGTGTAGNLIVAGTLSPGNAAAGTLSATGNATFRAGSTFAVGIAAAGGADRLNVAGAATIEGGTVAVTALDPELNYTDGSTFTFLSAAGGRTGTFAGLTESSAFLDMALGYSATTAFLTVDVVRTFPEVAQTFNQVQAATGLRELDRTAGSDSLAAYNAILLLDEAPARAAFDASSGEIYAALMASALRQSEMAGARLTSRAYEDRAEGLGLWGGVDGHDGSVDGDGNGARFDYDGLGGNLGVDWRGGSWAVGLGGGWSSGDVGLPDRASRAETDAWHIGAFASAGSGHSGFSAAASGVRTSGEADVTRSIAFGTISRTASSRVDVDTTALALDLRYGLPVGGSWAFGPAVGIAYSDVDLGQFAETGADSLGLSGEGSSDAWTSLAAGGFASLRSARGSFEASAQYLHGGDRVAEAGLTLAGAPSDPFRVRAAVGGEDAVLLRASGRFALGGGWSVGGNLRAVAGAGESSIAGAAVIGLTF